MELPEYLRNSPSRPQCVLDKQVYKEEDLPISFGTAPETVISASGDGFFVIDNVLTPEECRQIVVGGETLGFSFWDISHQSDEAFRSAFTIEIKHGQLSRTVYGRIEKYLQYIDITKQNDPRWARDLEGVWIPESFYEVLLLGRYTDGGHFSPHTDGTTYVDINRRTLFTTLLYLKNTEEGGNTFVLNDDSRDDMVLDQEGRWSSRTEHRIAAVKPIAGRMLVFYHDIMHEGEGVSSPNSKYIIRSDIVYRRSPEILTTPRDRRAFELWVKSQESAERDGDAMECLRLLKQANRLSSEVATLMGFG